MRLLFSDGYVHTFLQVSSSFDYELSYVVMAVVSCGGFQRSREAIRFKLIGTVS